MTHGKRKQKNNSFKNIILTTKNRSEQTFNLKYHLKVKQSSHIIVQIQAAKQNKVSCKMQKAFS